MGQLGLQFCGSLGALIRLLGCAVRLGDGFLPGRIIHDPVAVLAIDRVWADLKGNRSAVDCDVSLAILAINA
jgi:hypothetical protein